jgi:plasmid maintenance system antidote protein VapI
VITLVSSPANRKSLFDSVTEQKFTGTLAGNVLTGNVLHVYDAIDDDTLTKIIDHFGTPRYIIMDGFSSYQTSLDIPIFCIDAWIEDQLTQMESTGLTLVDDVKVEHVANFVINAKQINRFLAMKLSEIFNIDVDYTWSGLGQNFNLEHIVQEKKLLNDSLIDQHWTQLLAPIAKFEKKWRPNPGEKIVGDSKIVNPGDHAIFWNTHLRHVVSKSAISIITESVWTQQASLFTEKTVYSVLGLTFPIWVGGVNAATCWKDKGFDIFDDVIDHSYQNLPTLLERCFYAFYLNKDILTDLEKASFLRKQHVDRLIANRNCMTSDTFRKYNQTQFQKWPNDLQELANASIMKYLPGLKGYL